MMYKVTFNFQAWGSEFPDLNPDQTLRESFHVSANDKYEAFCKARYQAEHYAYVLGYGGTCLPAITSEDADIVIRESSQQEIDAELEKILSDSLLATL